MKKLFGWYYKHIGKVFWIIAVTLISLLIVHGSGRLPNIYQLILEQVLVVGGLLLTFTLIINFVKIYKEYKTIQFDNMWGKVWWWVKHG